MKKIAVFADVQNIYYTTKQAFNRQFNYRALWRFLEERGDIQHAFAYAIESVNDKQRSFQNTLRHIGFNILLKPYIQRHDGSRKADWDVGIAIDMLEAAPNFDELILLSGDGDFDILLQRIHQRFEAKCLVISVAQLTAQSLLKEASAHIDIDERFLL